MMRKTMRSVYRRTKSEIEYFDSQEEINECQFDCSKSDSLGEIMSEEVNSNEKNSTERIQQVVNGNEFFWRAMMCDIMVWQQKRRVFSSGDSIFKRTDSKEILAVPYADIISGNKQKREQFKIQKETPMLRLLYHLWMISIPHAPLSLHIVACQTSGAI